MMQVQTYQRIVRCCVCGAEEVLEVANSDVAWSRVNVRAGSEVVCLYACSSRCREGFWVPCADLDARRPAYDGEDRSVQADIRRATRPADHDPARGDDLVLSPTEREVLRQVFMPVVHQEDFLRVALRAGLSREDADALARVIDISENASR